MMPDDGNLDPSCSRLHHDEYETNGGLITHLQSLNPQSNREVRAELGTMRTGTTVAQQRRTSGTNGSAGTGIALQSGDNLRDNEKRKINKPLRRLLEMRARSFLARVQRKPYPTDI